MAERRVSDEALAVIERTGMPINGEAARDIVVDLRAERAAHARLLRAALRVKATKGGHLVGESESALAFEAALDMLMAALAADGW
jgi:hypothetical protein